MRARVSWTDPRTRARAPAWMAATISTSEMRVVERGYAFPSIIGANNAVRIRLDLMAAETCDQKRVRAQ